MIDIAGIVFLGAAIAVFLALMAAWATTQIIANIERAYFYRTEAKRQRDTQAATAASENWSGAYLSKCAENAKLSQEIQELKQALRQEKQRNNNLLRASEGIRKGATK